MHVRVHVLPIVALTALSAAGAASAQSRFEVAGQATVLRLSDFGDTSAGVGGRVAYDLTHWATADGEFNFFPKDDVSLAATSIGDGTMRLEHHRRRAEGFFGLKLGRRSERFGLFGKVRPGFARLTDKGVACIGDVCALVLFLIAPSNYRTEFALDLGGVFEFYPTVRTVARVDLGDTMIRHRSLAPPCTGCTSHNFTSRFGVGFRF